MKDLFKREIQRESQPAPLPAQTEVAPSQGTNFSNPTNDFHFADINVHQTSPPKANPESDSDWLRNAVGNKHNYDLSNVNLHPNSLVLSGSPLEAVTYGADIHFHGALDLNSAHGQHVMAHELTHTVQQATKQRGSYQELELDAERGANDALQTSDTKTTNLSPLPNASQPVPQAFDPRFHRESVVESLSTGGTTGDGEGRVSDLGPSGFTDEEIGMVYQANWERDLSQLHPSVGEVILAWKDIKLAAVSDTEDRETRVQAAEEVFRGACTNVLDLVQTMGPDAFALNRAYGGYAFWEHMDNPGAEINDAIRNRRVELNIPDNVQNPHLFVAKEYIKEMLFDAVQIAHPTAILSGNAADAARDSSARRTALVASSLDYDHGSGDATPVEGTRPTSTIASETALQVHAAHPETPTGTTGIPPEALEKLGRASHSLEDFWSHSNFVEMAIGEAEFNSGLGALEAENTTTGGDSRTQGLTTSTFDDADAKHSVAHKIRGLADEIDTEVPLIEHMLGRRASLPTPDEVRVGDTALPTPEDHEDESLDYVGDIARAQQQTSFFDAFIRNPATIGAGIGGGVGGALHPTDDADQGYISPYAGAFLGGGVLGGFGGLATGWSGGAMSGGNYAENELGLGVVGGAVGAGLGGLVGALTGTVGGVIGGVGGSWVGYDDESRTAQGGALAGAGLFGSRNLFEMASGLGGSHVGVALLRGLAEHFENSSREGIANSDRTEAERAGTHSMLAKDQPGHDESSQDVLRTKKFELSRALSIASDRMVIGQMREALTNSDPAAATARLEAVQATIDTLIAIPDAAHPLYSIIEAHRAEIETALTTHYQSQPPAATDAANMEGMEMFAL